jgi:hypothetical protein
MTLYLNDEYELLNERPAKKLSDVQVETSSYFGNSEIEYLFHTPLHINEWNLRSIVIYRKWNESFIKKVITYRNQMAPINLKESIDSNRIVVPRKWYNRENTELGLNSQILRKVILFLETVPVELKTAQGIKLYFTGLNCINMIDLSQFYKEFLNSRNILSESDIRFLEKFFVNKMDTLLSE